jgi:hypothetical protein
MHHELRSTCSQCGNRIPTATVSTSDRARDPGAGGNAPGRAMRRLQPCTPACETGVVQFGEDRPGLFIEGKLAAQFALLLKHVIAGHAYADEMAKLRVLQHLLEGLVVESPAPADGCAAPGRDWR